MSLLISGRSVNTMFDLLGQDENAMTAALGFALEQSPALRSSILRELGCPEEISRGEATIRLQSWRLDRGITDIEIRVGSAFLAVIEAKQGAWLPSVEQLQLYAPILQNCKIVDRCLATLSDATAAFARQSLPEMIDGEPVRHLSWRRILALVEAASSIEGMKPRRVLAEVAHFLEGCIGMESLYSNLVYVVSLGGGTPTNWPISWIDIVAKHSRYFYPVGKHWPDPPNYLGVRYGGRLQSIHHVEQFDIFSNPNDVFPSVPSEVWEPHYLLTLGPPIRPSHDVKNGPRITMNNRCWCMLDTLLTSPTISDALLQTKKRIEGWRVA